MGDVTEFQAIRHSLGWSWDPKLTFFYMSKRHILLCSLNGAKRGVKDVETKMWEPRDLVAKMDVYIEKLRKGKREPNLWDGEIQGRGWDPGRVSQHLLGYVNRPLSHLSRVSLRPNTDNY